MGQLFSRMYKWMTVEARILMLGLDGAGKTTLLYKLKLCEKTHTVPTIGFNVETIYFGKLQMTMWDIGGQHKLRSLWKHYFQNADAMIFIIDSTDWIRLSEAQQELYKVLHDPNLTRTLKCVLILANKQDLPNAADLTTISEVLELNRIKLPWYIHGCCALTGDNVHEGIDILYRVFR